MKLHALLGHMLSQVLCKFVRIATFIGFSKRGTSNLMAHLSQSRLDFNGLLGIDNFAVAAKFTHNFGRLNGYSGRTGL